MAQITDDPPDQVVAAVPFYGLPQGDMEPDWSPLKATIRGHMAEHDEQLD